MHLWIQCTLIRESRDQFAFDQFPGLIAVFHALHRLLAPRHPPHALSSLAALIAPLPVTGLEEQSRFRYHAVVAYHNRLCNVNPRYSLDAYRDLFLAQLNFR